MGKEKRFETGAYLRDLREGKKVSRNDLKHICHANTLRNFEVGYNQINIDDFLELFIELGNTTLRVKDVLRYSDDEKYTAYVELTDMYDSNRHLIYDVNHNLLEVSNETKEMFTAFIGRMQAYFGTKQYEETPVALKQEMYAAYLVLKASVNETDESDLVKGFALYEESYTIGQKKYDDSEFMLLHSLLLQPSFSGKPSLRLCEKALETIKYLDLINDVQILFVTAYFRYLKVNDSRRFSLLRRKYIDANEQIIYYINLQKKK